MGLDDERWARPDGPRPTGSTAPRVGLIDPALHRLPPAYATSAATPSARYSGEDSGAGEVSGSRADPTPDELVLGDELVFGTEPATGRERRPYLRRVGVTVVAVVVAATVLAGIGAATLQARDTRETLTQEQLATAITTFRPDVLTSDTDVQSAAELRSDQPTQTDPAGCAELIDVAPVGAQSGASWTSFVGRQDSYLQAIRFADPGQARDALATVSSAAQSCQHVSLGDAATGTADAGFDVVARSPEVRFGPRDRVFYTLRWARTAETEDSGYREFEIYLRRFGNVIVWGIGPSTAEAPHRAAADNLTTRLRELAAS